MKSIEAHMRKAEQFGRKCYEEGKHSGAVYYGGAEHWKFINDVMGMQIVSNTLHMDQFLPIVQMEAEIIRMVLNLFHGDATTCGIGTSGGTESILLAMLAYREQGREKGITEPNIVVSDTAHSAFHKAAFYFGIEVKTAPLTKDLLCNVAGMRSLIDSNTVCLVSSGPEYPFGNFDPLPEIAALAHSYGIGCHYDSCIGFINCFAEEAGFELPYASDFRVVGLTSISVDTHKYGFGPKGYSLCLFKTVELRDYQFFTHMNW